MESTVPPCVWLWMSSSQVPSLLSSLVALKWLQSSTCAQPSRTLEVSVNLVGPLQLSLSMYLCVQCSCYSVTSFVCTRILELFEFSDCLHYDLCCLWLCAWTWIPPQCIAKAFWSHWNTSYTIQTWRKVWRLQVPWLPCMETTLQSRLWRGDWNHPSSLDAVSFWNILLQLRVEGMEEAFGSNATAQPPPPPLSLIRFRGLSWINVSWFTLFPLVRFQII